VVTRVLAVDPAIPLGNVVPFPRRRVSSRRTSPSEFQLIYARQIVFIIHRNTRHGRKVCASRDGTNEYFSKLDTFHVGFPCNPACSSWLSCVSWLYFCCHRVRRPFNAPDKKGYEGEECWLESFHGEGVSKRGARFLNQRGVIYTKNMGIEK